MRIVLDCGHGANTAGKRTPPFLNDVARGNVTVKKGQSFKEHEANVGIAVLLYDELKRCGFDVLRSGWDDANALDDRCPLSPSEDVTARQKAIKGLRADVCVSLHFNAYGTSFNSARGACVYIGDKESRRGDSLKLAGLVRSEIIKALGQNDRGVVKNNDLGMTNCAGLGVKAAILIEHAFMTNWEEAEGIMCNPDAWAKYAVAEAKAICAYTGVAYVSLTNRKLKLTDPYMRGEDVKKLQRLIGVDDDGVYGPGTDKRVKDILEALGQ